MRVKEKEREREFVMSERGKKEKVLKRISRKIVAYSHTLAHSPILLHTHTHTHRGIYSLPLFTLTHTHSL